MVEIYYDDLKPGAQYLVRELYGITDVEKETNWDTVPLFILEKPEIKE